MSKIDIIDYCGDCSKRYYKGNYLYCEPHDRETYENNPIPSWCPLPDAVENKLMPCGHPQSAVVSSDEGTNYCGECERKAKCQ